MSHDLPPESDFSLPRLGVAWELRVRGERDAAIRLLGRHGLRPHEVDSPGIHSLALELPGLQLARARRLLREAGWERAPDSGALALSRNGVRLVLVPPSAPARAALAAARRATKVFRALPAEDQVASFLDLKLRVPAGVFAPNPTSEHLARAALAHVPTAAPALVVDVGTGSGAVAIHLALQCPHAEVHGTDTARRGVAAARKNARRLGADNVHFHHGSLLDPLPRALRGGLDVVVANLPWLPPVVLAAERARGRLTEAAADTMSGGDDDGLGLLRRFLPRAARWMAPGGVLLLQAAAWQTRPVTALLLEAGFSAPAGRTGTAPLVARRLP